MVGGPIGGMLADKVTKSPTVYLKWTFLISAVAMLCVHAVTASNNERVYRYGGRH